MCGIFLTNDPLVTEDKFSVVEKTLRFRGPDCSSGVKEIGNWKAYHSRLSIIDPNSGTNQPVINNDGSILVFNGEILNYKELGEKYFSKEYSSDTFLLNDLIINKCLQLNELDGFFAFSFVDINGELSHCARDKFGVKPLFYHKNNGYITISSEPSTLKNIFNLPVNEDAIYEYKVFRAPLISESFYEGVKQVAPGTCLVSGEYFSVHDELSGEYKEVSNVELENKLKDGINSRKVSDVPIGLLLSKGVDSNLIHQFSNINKLYSIGFPGDADFEYLKTQKLENLDLYECTEEEYKEEFFKLLHLREEPLSVPNEVLISIIAKRAAKDGVKVLLSGEGADEFFGGYDRIFQWAHHTKEFEFEHFIKLYSYNELDSNSNLYEKIKLLFQKEFANPFEAVRWFFIRYHMPILFRRLDFSTMAAGVEGREPIANVHLFDLAKSLSSTQLMGDKLGKYPLRELISVYKGRDFGFADKVGFPVNIKAIFSDETEKSNYDIWFEKNLEILK
jgi:asparagine synthase (glutamine-hydrolysing)